MTGPDEPITTETVAAAAVLAGLPLGEDRAAAVAGLLAAWIPAANALSARMQVEAVRPLMPTTVFGQPPADGGTDR
ncbi:hypothetical protein [Actinomycetospora straminea]|uniref:DUF4089 domain-containing protein n=1 Tax=Actinomycetospora straminea TaxID=663607 RepID=A0ABP9EK29_9PSEU|nr:hypothetical protein [Actinomycetospora straminea]MDD7936702.1 hypothetical protein [Actinomycetospora straminea]